MSQPKDPKRYPPRVRAIPYYLKHLPYGERFRIPFDSKQEALAFRAAVYGYRAAILACRNDEKLQEKYFISIPDIASYLDEFGENFEHAMFLIEHDEDGWWFTFRAARGEDLLTSLEEDLERRKKKGTAGLNPPLKK